MANYWMLDVLTDLQVFAGNNDLPDIAGGIDELIDIAAAEIALKVGDVPTKVQGQDGIAGELLRQNGGRHHA